MNSWRKQQPTAQAKAAAHNFYGADELKDDLEPFVNVPGIKRRATPIELDPEVEQWSHCEPPPAGTFGPKAPTENALAPAALDEAYEQVRNRPSRTRNDDAADDEDDTPNPRMRAQFTELGAIEKFVHGGKAIVTVVSKRTKQRFTYKFTRPKQSTRPGQPPTFVSVLSGPDNTTAYSYVGTMFPSKSDPLEIVHTAKSRISKDAPSAKAAQWFVRALAAGSDVLEQCEVWHEGRCGRCGRTLTVPESIESGFGPECITKI